MDERLTNASVEDVAAAWAQGGDWEILSVTGRQGAVIVRAVGAPPSPEPAALRRALDRAGLAEVDVKLQLVPEVRVDLEGSR